MSGAERAPDLAAAAPRSDAPDPAAGDPVAGDPDAPDPAAHAEAPHGPGPGLPPPTAVESLVGALLEAGPEVAEHVVRAAQELLLAVQAIVDAADRAVQEQQRLAAEANADGDTPGDTTGDDASRDDASPDDATGGGGASVHHLDRSE